MGGCQAAPIHLRASCWVAMRYAPRHTDLAARQEASLSVILHADVAREPFDGGATYQTLVGDQQGSTPFRLGLQTSPPGYRTPLHSHPSMEALTVISGEGEAW